VAQAFAREVLVRLTVHRPDLAVWHWQEQNDFQMSMRPKVRLLNRMNSAFTGHPLSRKKQRPESFTVRFPVENRFGV